MFERTENAINQGQGENPENGKKISWNCPFVKKIMKNDIIDIAFKVIFGNRYAATTTIVFNYI
jgi:hypothetical protein